MNPKKTGFTLLEMLVVVAVILILFAILMPALGRAKEAGRSARCASNLHQLQLASLDYAMGNNGNFPGQNWVSSNIWYGLSGQTSISGGVLWVYVKAKDVYLCPTFALPSVCGRPDAVRSYSIVTGAKATMTNASSQVLFADDRSITNSPDTTMNATNVAKWHTGRGNVVYVDGHVAKWPVLP